MFRTKAIVSQIRAIFPKRLASKLPQEIGVVLLKPEESARLNLIYRNKNKATNVLSFYYSPEYGEILICPEIVKKEAQEAKNPQKYQMTHMIVHGMLHLAGVHHENSQGLESKFIQLEKKLLAKLFGS